MRRDPVKAGVRVIGCVLAVTLSATTVAAQRRGSAVTGDAQVVAEASFVASGERVEIYRVHFASYRFVKSPVDAAGMEVRLGADQR